MPRGEQQTYNSLVRLTCSSSLPMIIFHSQESVFSFHCMIFPRFHVEIEILNGIFFADCMLDLILVISCIPVSPMDQTLSPINRPLEIAVEGFKIGTGHSVGSLFHDFVDPGPLAAGSLLAVTEARKFCQLVKSNQ
jgi:hypothetical protein